MTEVAPAQVTPGEAWRTYFETTAMLTAELERRLKDAEQMDLGDFNLLLVLSESDRGGVRLGELARALSFGPGRLTYRLGVLEKRGWLLRRPCEQDGRGSVAVLTDEGWRVLRHARRTHARHVHDLFLDDLSGEQARLLHAVFAPLRERLAERD